MPKGDYTATIGLEVHAELKTATKMFCDSKNDPHHAEPNTHICPICMGHPGTLPTVNKEAVKAVLAVGHAVGGALATYTEFDRKNYFYPDIPKGYQISQYAYPLVSGGELAGVALTRIHLEEDTARSLHDQGAETLLDYNRAGVPLMELVTEPVIHNAETAGAFARELQLLLRSLGVSDAHMEEGGMRVEANISISKDGSLGTKVEVKNLNSFKVVERAIVFEIDRQAKLLDKGELVVQETRGWDENKGKTFSQREKESAHDYRYFPDPDIPKLQIDEVPEFSESRLSEISDKKPSNKREKYLNLGLDEKKIEVLISNMALSNFFDELIALESKRSILEKALNYILSDILGYIQSTEGLDVNTMSAPHFLSLVRLLDERAVTSRVAKDLLPEVIFERKDPETLANERGLLQQNDESALGGLVAQILKDNPDVVKEYKNGKDASIQFLIGQGMKLTNGSANPETLKTLIQKELS